MGWFSKDKPKDTTVKKPDPKMLGTGMAAKAGESLKNRARQNCEAAGGTYDAATGKCNL